MAAPARMAARDHRARAAARNANTTEFEIYFHSLLLSVTPMLQSSLDLGKVRATRAA